MYTIQELFCIINYEIYKYQSMLYADVSSFNDPAILRGEIDMLHSQLMFERHKRETHSQRNRRLLSRIVKTTALKEQNNAMVTTCEYIHVFLKCRLLFMLYLYICLKNIGKLKILYGGILVMLTWYIFRHSEHSDVRPAAVQRSVQ